MSRVTAEIDKLENVEVVRKGSYFIYLTKKRIAIGDLKFHGRR